MTIHHTTQGDPMTRSDTYPTRPPAIPGVVDGSLTVCQEVDGISFHVVVGSDHDAVGESMRVEFVISPQHVEIIREALASDSGPTALSVPCCVGILLIR